MLDRWALNAQQYQIVTAPAGHMLINAAAGTGKTKTMAARILYLQQKGIAPGHIMALSFSRAARAQLTDRVRSYCREFGEGSPVATFTFHGLAYRLVRLGVASGEVPLKRGFELLADRAGGPSIVFSENGPALLKRIEQPQGIETELERYARALNALRQKGYYSPSQLPKDRLFQFQCGDLGRYELPTESIATVWKRYNSLLERMNAIDHPGLIAYALQIMENEGSAARHRAMDGLEYIIVDEFQDTSRAMLRLLVGLASEGASVNAVGDSDQTIYTVNGSDPSNMLEFVTHFCNTPAPVLGEMHLTLNYRSTPNILKVANRAISHAMTGRTKTLEPAPDRLPDPLERWRQANRDVVLVEAPRLDLAADCIAHECRRLNAECGIPWQDIAVLYRANSKVDAKAAQGDEVRRALTHCGVPIAETQFDHNAAAKVRDAAIEICNAPDNYNRHVFELIADIRSGVLTCEGVDADDVISALEEQSALGADKAWQALDLLVDSAPDEDGQGSERTCGVQVRTIHSAKGAEFRVVFLVYLGEKQFPYGIQPDYEEERRLLYVGLTRAQERLYVLGQPRGSLFFGQLLGDGTTQWQWTVPGGHEGADGPPLDERWRRAVLAAEQSVKTDASYSDDEDLDDIYGGLDDEPQWGWR